MTPAFIGFGLFHPPSFLSKESQNPAHGFLSSLIWKNVMTYLIDGGCAVFHRLLLFDCGRCEFEPVHMHWPIQCSLLPGAGPYEDSFGAHFRVLPLW